MEKVKKMDQLIKFLVVFSILLSHIPIDMVYAEEISQSNNTVESNRQESEQVMNHPLERNNPLVQLIANPPEGGNPQQDPMLIGGLSSGRLVAALGFLSMMFMQNLP